MYIKPRYITKAVTIARFLFIKPRKGIKTAIYISSQNTTFAKKLYYKNIKSI